MVSNHRGYDFMMITISKIRRVVSAGFGVTPQEIMSRTRRQPIATARQAIIYYSRKVLGLKYSDLGFYFNRNHSNMLHADRTINDRKLYDRETRAILDSLESEFPWLQREVEVQPRRRKEVA